MEFSRRVSVKDIKGKFEQLQTNSSAESPIARDNYYYYRPPVRRQEASYRGLQDECKSDYRKSWKSSERVEKEKRAENNSDYSTSFSEKQKVVAGIIMNIKNSQNSHKDDSVRLRDLDKKSNSKLEKNIKNTLERVVRRQSAKIGTMQTNEDNFLNIEHSLRPDSLRPRSEIHHAQDYPKERTGNLSENEIVKRTFSSDSHCETSRHRVELALDGAEGTYEVPKCQEVDCTEPVKPPRRCSPSKKPRPPNGNSSSKMNERTHSDLGLYASLSFEGEQTPQYGVPEGSLSPPQKPPRTFAHDIYRNLTNKRNTREHKVLTPEEIDSMYAKPVKKSLRNGGSPSQVTFSKPVIAPKPSGTSSKTKLDQFPQTSEYKDDSTLNRNAAFTFSLRNKKSAAICNHFRFTLSRKNNRNSKTKINKSKNGVTKQKSKSDENLYASANSERIYDIPSEDEPRTNKPELHYMCSPLFNDAEEVNGYTCPEKCPRRGRIPPKETVPQSKPGLMIGLREEWRQSCRFVQKRLKSLSPYNRNA